MWMNVLFFQLIWIFDNEKCERMRNGSTNFSNRNKWQTQLIFYEIHIFLEYFRMCATNDTKWKIITNRNATYWHCKMSNWHQFVWNSLMRMIFFLLSFSFGIFIFLIRFKRALFTEVSFEFTSPTNSIQLDLWEQFIFIMHSNQKSAKNKWISPTDDAIQRRIYFNCETWMILLASGNKFKYVFAMSVFWTQYKSKTKQFHFILVIYLLVLWALFAIDVEQRIHF